MENAVLSDQELREVIRDNAATDPGFALAWAVLEVGGSIATHLKYLGTGDAATTMGAIEHLAAEIKAGLDGLAAAIGEMSLP